MSMAPYSIRSPERWGKGEPSGRKGYVVIPNLFPKRPKPPVELFVGELIFHRSGFFVVKVQWTARIIK